MSISRAKWLIYSCISVITEHFRAQLNNTSFLREEHTRNYPLLENIIKVCGYKNVKYMGGIRYKIQGNFVICTYYLDTSAQMFQKSRNHIKILCAKG